MFPNFIAKSNGTLERDQVIALLRKSYRDFARLKEIPLRIAVTQGSFFIH